MKLHVALLFTINSQDFSVISDFLKSHNIKKLIFHDSDTIHQAPKTSQICLLKICLMSVLDL